MYTKLHFCWASSRAQPKNAQVTPPNLVTIANVRFSHPRKPIYCNVISYQLQVAVLQFTSCSFTIHKFWILQALLAQPQSKCLLLFIPRKHLRDEIGRFAIVPKLLSVQFLLPGTTYIRTYAQYDLINFFAGCKYLRGEFIFFPCVSFVAAE
jgi:hypothetical protein